MILAPSLASTALVIKASGLVTEASVIAFVEAARSTYSAWLVAAVVFILLIDLQIAAVGSIPTSSMADIVHQPDSRSGFVATDRTVDGLCGIEQARPG